MDVQDAGTDLARLEGRREPPTGGTLTGLILLGIVLQLIAALMIALAWPRSGDSRHSGQRGSAAVVALGLGVVELAGILILIGAVGWGVLTALRIRDAGRGE